MPRVGKTLKKCNCKNANNSLTVRVGETVICDPSEETKDSSEQYRLRETRTKIIRIDLTV